MSYLNNLLEHMKDAVPSHYEFPMAEVLAILREDINLPLKEKAGSRGYQFYLHNNDKTTDKDYDVDFKFQDEDEEAMEFINNLENKLAPYYCARGVCTGSIDPVSDILQYHWDEVYNDLHVQE
jgi:hypothetical protein